MQYVRFVASLSVALALSAAAAAPAALPSGYESWSAQRKQDHLWREITESEYRRKPSLANGSLYTLLNGRTFDAQRLAETITTVSDELPASRRGLKVIHTFGTCATFELEPAAGSPYTGLFQGGSGILRFSYAGPPALIGNVPGLGLKFLLDGRPSENLVVMNKLNSQGPYTSVFQETFSNILPRPTGVIMTTIQVLFENVVGAGNGFHQGLEHLARVDRAGKTVETPRAPHQIFFVPTDEHGISPRSRSDFRIDLESVRSGTAIYDVYATERDGAERTRIGRVTTRSAFVASEYGDHALFFRHSDRFLRPELRPR